MKKGDELLSVAATAPTDLSGTTTTRRDSVLSNKREVIDKF